MSDVKTFRGLSLAEVEAKVRAELGDDAVIVRQREGLSGGVGGFFQRRIFEVDANGGNGTPAPTSQPEQPVAQVAPAPAEDFAAQLKAALAPELEKAAAEQQLAAEAAAEFIPEPIAASTPAPAPKTDAAALAALFAPDAQRAPVEWPEEDREPVAAAPLPEPEILPAPVPVPAAAPLPAAPATPNWPVGATKLQSRLVERGLSRDLVSGVVDEAVTHLLPFASQNRLKPLVASALARRIPVQPLRGAGGRVIGFVGPGGAGKTRCVARLAHAYALRSPAPVTCLTLRAEDDGAELRRLLASCGVPVHALDDATEARARVANLPDDALVVVDTPGVSPRAEAELRQLAAELRQLRLDETHLALPATMGADAGRDLVTGARSLGVDALTLTHTDETERLGGAIELAIETQLPISYIGRGTIVTGGLRPALPEELAAAVIA
jgi:flagellar biosynthesis protein FlhF